MSSTSFHRYLCRDPLTFSESLFVAEQIILIDVIIHQTMPKIQTPLFGAVGPFIRGECIQVPLYIVRLLADEGVGYPALPEWMEEEMLPVLVKQESENRGICPCPHPFYIELTKLFKNSSYNPWADSPNPVKTRASCLQLLEDLIALRKQKVTKLIEPFIRDKGAMTTDLSHLERRRLGVIGVEYMKQLESPPTYQTDPIEDVLASMNFDFTEHFELLEKAQDFYNLGEEDDLDNNSNNRSTIRSISSRIATE